MKSRIVFWKLWTSGELYDGILRTATSWILLALHLTSFCRLYLVISSVDIVSSHSKTPVDNDSLWVANV
jgi:hypothetical protein